MSGSTFRGREAENKIISCAREIIDGKLGVIDGSKIISKLRFDTDCPEDEIFFPFRSIDSDSDEFFILYGSGINNSPLIKSMIDAKEDHEKLLKQDTEVYCEELIEYFSK